MLNKNFTHGLLLYFKAEIKIKSKNIFETVKSWELFKTSIVIYLSNICSNWKSKTPFNAYCGLKLGKLLAIFVCGFKTKKSYLVSGRHVKIPWDNRSSLFGCTKRQWWDTETLTKALFPLPGYLLHPLSRFTAEGLFS